MGKVEIGNFCCLTAGIQVEFFFTECFLSSPLRFILILSKSLNLIGCHGNIKVNFRKIFKNLLLRSRKGDEAETLHTCS